MEDFLYRTKGNAYPKGKPRIYFTCHPTDFDLYFNQICTDIFKTHDPAVYYTADMSKPISTADRETGLDQMNLFVVPVTAKLLKNPCRAMQEDIPYAQKKGIPILPLMMEAGLDRLYARPDKFGALQYLSLCSSDSTEIDYREKLQKYLESVLINDETVKRIRAAFDAYIFLSYRKKDRLYANQLIRLIHSYPEYQDIAIWYDEFLTPGESFQENIDKAIEDSQLFALLVTPHLLEEPNGRPNFVMGQEYPRARQAGINILPTEMQLTDQAKLREKFTNLPDCVDPNEERLFKARLLQSLRRISHTGNDEVAEHKFLIGLAYLGGIDVEIDRPRALSLLTEAAEAGLPEAMKKLRQLYTEGNVIPASYATAVYWGKRLLALCRARYGEKHAETLLCRYHLAWDLEQNGEYREALLLLENTVTLFDEVHGSEHYRTLTALTLLSTLHGDIGDYHKALEMNKLVYSRKQKTLGETHDSTLISANNLGLSYLQCAQYQKAAALYERIYAMRRRLSGEEHPETLTVMSNLAITYSSLGEHQKALELREKAYTAKLKVLGEEHPGTLIELHNLAVTYYNLADYERAASLSERVLNLRCRILGEEHPDTVQTLANLAHAYEALGDHQKDIALSKKAYDLQCRLLGEEHPETLGTLRHLARAYGNAGNGEQYLSLMQRTYQLQCKVLGEKHPKTLLAMNDLGVAHSRLNQFSEAAGLFEKAFLLRYQISGEGHAETEKTLKNLIFAFDKLGKQEKKLDAQKILYDLRCKSLGEEHLQTLIALNDIGVTQYQLGQRQKALETMQRALHLAQKALGDAHPQTQQCQRNLEVIRQIL